MTELRPATSEQDAPGQAMALKMADVKELPKLPYSYDALEPYIDAKTMEVHYTMHHQAYVTKLNAALERAPELQEKNLVELVAAVGTKAIPDDVQTAVRNHGGGHWNHSMFWKVMAPKSSEATSFDKSATPELKDAITKNFGSYKHFVDQFSEAAASVFGSGWAWLQVDASSFMLTVTTTGNQDSPLMTHVVKAPGYPVLGLDVWEHAYYLKHLAKRPDYIEDWWHVVNWKQASETFSLAKQGKPAST